MICNVENGKLIIEDKGSVYTFEAHGEAPRPSMLGMGLSAAGKHRSDRNENTKLEKHTSIEDVALCDKYAAWYTQEFIPDGEDYKMSKNAAIYLGDLQAVKPLLYIRANATAIWSLRRKSCFSIRETRSPLSILRQKSLPYFSSTPR